MSHATRWLGRLLPALYVRPQGILGQSRPSLIRDEHRLRNLVLLPIAGNWRLLIRGIEFYLFKAVSFVDGYYPPPCSRNRRSDFLEKLYLYRYCTSGIEVNEDVNEKAGVDFVDHVEILPAVELR